MNAVAPEQHIDVLIVGAGLSGIAAAYRVKTNCPTRSFAVLEARDAVGGTWDLFRYPGIRSDSDMHTLGFSFYPWPDAQAIADGPSILAYLNDTVREFDLGPSIHFGLRVEHASWSSETNRWMVRIRRSETDETFEVTCNFLWACTGYYDYEAGYTPDFPGVEKFQGRVVHPQHWTPDIEYEDKRVVVIGSGATAVTLVPELAKRAAHVTMLQRSPGYVLSLPETDPVAALMQRAFGDRIGFSLTRWKNVLRMMVFFQASRRFPKQARRLLMNETRKMAAGGVEIEPHFSPKYDPWDQRICFVPDNDMFKAFKDGSASVVTDHIESFTESGIALESGETLEADLVVTATGLRIQMLGGATVEVDGEPFTPGDRLLYKGTMISDVPNAAISIGYTNASWTLKCELISEYICRLLNYMEANDFTRCTPRRPADVQEIPLLDFNSGYVLRALGNVPKQGSRAPWRLYQNYILDRRVLRRAPIDDSALEFE